MSLSRSELHDFLEFHHDKYNRPEFIEDDPICIPHLFSKKEDIEISGFLAATIAWGKRSIIIKNARTIVELMDHAPHDFVINHKTSDLKRFDNFVHRTFNTIDLSYFILALKNIYTNHGGLEQVLAIKHEHEYNFNALVLLNQLFFELDHQTRTEKHISNPKKGSAAKRLNMFYRWMVRKDNRGVDFGIWNFPTSKLICPLDVHTGNVARKIGLLSRKQNDWIAAVELSENLARFDKKDPIKYDFALFGAGIYANI